jgi:hypothetical protein
MPAFKAGKAGAFSGGFAELKIPERAPQLSLPECVFELPPAVGPPFAQQSPLFANRIPGLAGAVFSGRFHTARICPSENPDKLVQHA